MMMSRIARGSLVTLLALATAACGSTLYLGGDIHPVRRTAVTGGWAYVVGDPVIYPYYAPYIPTPHHAVYGPGVVSY